MDNINSVIIGAIIALIGTLITNLFAYKTSKNKEHMNFTRLKEHLRHEERMTENKFHHEIIMNNRETILVAAESILLVSNNLFRSTKNLTSNYPGVFWTGKKPSLQHNNSIDSYDGGFPDSLEIVYKIDKEWVASFEEFENVFEKNTIFIPEEIRFMLIEYKNMCKVIRDYYYGLYHGITNSDFNKKRSEYFEKNYLDRVDAPSKIVVSYYIDVENYKNKVVDKLSVYVNEKTNMYDNK